MDCGLSVSPVHGISQARILEWVAISFSRRSFWPRGWTYISCIANRSFTTELPGKPICIYIVRHMCMDFMEHMGDPVDCSPPGSSVHGILQARILEWVTISFSRGSPQPMDQTQVSHISSDALPSEPPNWVVHMYTYRYTSISVYIDRCLQVEVIGSKNL